MRRGRFTLIRQHTAGDEGRLGLVVRIPLNDDCEADQEAFSEPKIEADDFSFSPLGKVGSFEPSLARRYCVSERPTPSFMPSVESHFVG